MTRPLQEVLRALLAIEFASQGAGSLQVQGLLREGSTRLASLVLGAQECPSPSPFGSRAPAASTPSVEEVISLGAGNAKRITEEGDEAVLRRLGSSAGKVDEVRGHAFSQRVLSWFAMTRKGLQSQDSSPYSAGPPWSFRGRAFYQLHLVKAEVAKRFIPSDLQIVQAFGYTLGGLYLAQYDSSPAGTFDELVIIAGTVWNPPTSCAWAARVFVNNIDACYHGKKEVGLPSKVASFSHPAIDVSEMDGSFKMPLCKILFPFDRHSLKEKQLIGPAISMSLPSFSGKTYEQPDLLKYSCRLKCSSAIRSAFKPLRLCMSILNWKNDILECL
ncbi:hypothetical protein L7F22_001241 [Adiantum nelumboides]|nr:hypothetical protein [Adiantum nelumboides]